MKSSFSIRAIATVLNETNTLSVQFCIRESHEIDKDLGGLKIDVVQKYKTSFLTRKCTPD